MILFKLFNVNVVDVIMIMVCVCDEYVYGSVCDDDEEKKRDENFNASIVEKRREVIVEISCKFKILFVSDDLMVMCKID